MHMCEDRKHGWVSWLRIGGVAQLSKVIGSYLAADLRVRLSLQQQSSGAMSVSEFKSPVCNLTLIICVGPCCGLK